MQIVANGLNLLTLAQNYQVTLKAKVIFFFLHKTFPFYFDSCVTSTEILLKRKSKALSVSFTNTEIYTYDDVVCRCNAKK